MSAHTRRGPCILRASIIIFAIEPKSQQVPVDVEGDAGRGASRGRSIRCAVQVSPGDDKGGEERPNHIPKTFRLLIKV